MRIAQPPRPYFSKLSLGVEAKTGMVVGFILSGPEATMAQTAARGLIQSAQTTGRRPKLIKVDSQNLFHALQSVCDALEIILQQAKSLPMATEARRAMEAFSRQQ